MLKLSKLSRMILVSGLILAFSSVWQANPAFADACSDARTALRKAQNEQQSEQKKLQKAVKDAQKRYRRRKKTVRSNCSIVPNIKWLCRRRKPLRRIWTPR